MDVQRPSEWGKQCVDFGFIFSFRVAAELAIETSSLKYTILRPTMIYGSDRDRNMWRLIRFMRYSPIVPIFGDGTSLQQPIYVDDVAQAIVGCLGSDKTIGKSYNIAGKHTPVRLINA